MENKEFQKRMNFLSHRLRNWDLIITIASIITAVALQIFLLFFSLQLLLFHSSHSEIFIGGLIGETEITMQEKQCRDENVDQYDPSEEDHNTNEMNDRKKWSEGIY
jgi:hypothetical protein